MATDPLIASDEEARAAIALLSPADTRVSEWLESHQVEYGKILPTVLLGDLAKMAFAESDNDELVQRVNWLLIVASPEVRNLLLTGFVEGVPVDVGDERIQRLPNPLRNEVQRDLGRPET